MTHRDPHGDVAAIREVDALITGHDLPLEIRIKVNAAMHALHDLLTGADRDAALVRWRAARAHVQGALDRRRASAS